MEQRLGLGMCEWLQRDNRRRFLGLWNSSISWLSQWLQWSVYVFKLIEQEILLYDHFKKYWKSYCTHTEKNSNKQKEYRLWKGSRLWSEYMVVNLRFSDVGCLDSEGVKLVALGMVNWSRMVINVIRNEVWRPSWLLCLGGCLKDKEEYSSSCLLSLLYARYCLTCLSCTLKNQIGPYI